jgi:membrane protein DedA with SNARE-associated domain
MDGFVADLGQFLQQHQVWAAPIVGLIVFGESLAVVGLVVPATAIMLVIGGLLGGGVLHPLPVVACAILGAVLGDIVSYAVGRTMGPRVVYRWPFARYREQVARTRLFFRHFGFATIFFGRFLGPIRSTVPLVAGIMAMDQRRFQLANVLSAVVWAPVMLAPGWLVGRGIDGLGDLGEGHLMGLAAFVFVVTVGAFLISARMMRSRRRVRGTARRTATS